MSPPSPVTRRGLFYAAGFAAVAASVGLDLTSRGSTAAAASIRPTVAGWGGYANGEIPLSALSAIGSHRFRKDAATALIALRAAYLSALGRALPINDGYRDLAGQWRAWNAWQNGTGNLAARPGTSNHGWAVAVDFGGEIYSSSASQGHRWLQANADRYGWWWAGRHFSQIENWHWEYNGRYQPEEEPEEEPIEEETEETPDMFLLMAQDTAQTPSIRWAVVAPGFWYVTKEKTTADGLSMRAGAQINVTWAEWDRAFAAAVSSGFVPASGQTARTV